MLDRVNRERLERRYRMILSWRDKARAVRDGARKARDFDLPPGLPADRAPAWFEKQAQLAEETLAEIRGKLAQRREKAQDHVRVAAHRQSRLPALVSGGKMTPVQANEENRRLQREIETQGAEATLCGALLAAEKAEDLGARIDLPLVRYFKEIERFASQEEDSEGDENPRIPPRPAPAPPVPKPVAQKKSGDWFPASWTRSDRYAVGIAAVLVFSVIALAVYFLQFSGGVKFDLLPGPQGVWRLVCENGSPKELRVGFGAGGAAPQTYTVILEYASAGEGAFQRVKDIDRVWIYRGPAADGDSVPVPPRMGAEWQLNLNSVSTPEPFETLRVRVLSPAGRVLLEERVSGAFPAQPSS